MSAVPPVPAVIQWICSCGVMSGSKPPVRGISKARDCPLLRDTDVLHHRLPQLLLLADEFGCLSRRHRLREGSEVHKLLPKFGVIEDGPQVLSISRWKPKESCPPSCV